MIDDIIELAFDIMEDMSSTRKKFLQWIVILFICAIIFIIWRFL